MSLVLVTGASGAAGDGVLEAFLADGWQVAGTTRRAVQDDAPAGVTWIATDLADETSARAGILQAVERLGGLDAVICLAGGFRLTPIDDAAWEDFAGLIDLDYRPTVVTVLAALPHLGEGGSIVTIGAQGGTGPRPSLDRVRGRQGGRDRLLRLAGGRAAAPRHPGELRAARHHRYSGQPRVDAEGQDRQLGHAPPAG
jgi:NAD(P)-dependent dehydrogenase (short-subunit alcohol dehydrogenase family)